MLDFFDWLIDVGYIIWSDIIIPGILLLLTAFIVGIGFFVGAALVIVPLLELMFPYM